MMINDMELEQVAGGNILEEVLETFETANDIAETILDVLGYGEPTTNNSTIVTHGTGASGSW